MKVINQIAPLDGQAETFFDVARDGPLAMVNLLKFRARAEYPDGDRGLSGVEAYALYGREVMKLVAAHGGRFVYGGAISGLLVGEVEEQWDSFALVEYPSNAAFQAMIEGEAYQKILPHRMAGLAGQLDIRVQPFSAR
ncbi:DUF1330 domain-containing protein [Erythrobacter sp.]|uniref:DUF1330 domain-containing protein n=1 Tax=Erythrobacter sp. TaxID=1042 RepID=UPI00311FEBCB